LRIGAEHGPNRDFRIISRSSKNWEPPWELNRRSQIQIVTTCCWTLQIPAYAPCRWAQKLHQIVRSEVSRSNWYSQKPTRESLWMELKAFSSEKWRGNFDYSKSEIDGR
jgi:hypothetical protein